MTDSDFNLIKPVENLHSVQSLAPAKQQQERKRRNRPEQPQEAGEEPLTETSQEQACDPDDDPHEIDYRA